MNVIVPYSVVYHKILTAHVNNIRYIVNVGSSRSTKTWSILQHIIVRCLESQKPLEVLIIRCKRTWLTATILKDFIKLMTDVYKIWDDENFNKNQLIYKLNKSTITFIGLDQDAGKQKAHGMKSDISYFNECIQIDKDSVNQILLRNTGQIFFDFNPSCSANHYIFTDILRREKSILIHSTYKDNPFLEPEVVAEIESREPTPENIARGSADETLWKIYGLGVRALVKGRIYPLVKMVEMMPRDVEYFSYGLDFGFTNHPTACVAVGIKGGDLYVDEIFYERGLVDLINPQNPSIRSIEGELVRASVSKRKPIAADDAEPKAIQNLKNNGWNIHKANKGSVLNGITSVKRFNIHVTERSLNIINEFENYKWAEDENENTINEVVKAFDHAMDAMRYATISIEPGKIGPRNPTIGIGTVARAGFGDKYDILGNKTMTRDMVKQLEKEREWLKANVNDGIV